MPPRARRCAVASCLAAWVVPIALAQAPSAQQAFATHAPELRAPGVRTFDGFTFATVVVPDARRGPQSTAAAIRLMLESRAAETLPVSRLPQPVGRAAASASVACLEGSFDASGVAKVEDRRLEDGMVRVVHALPSSRLASIEVRLPQLVDCLDRRSAAGTASIMDVLLLVELAPADRGPGGLMRSLSAACGDGIEATASRSWVLQGGRLPAQGLRGWQEAIASSVRDGAGFAPALRPLDGPRIAAISDPEEALRVLGSRANDPAILARASALLGGLGWNRCAAQLPAGAAPLTPAEERAGSRLPAPLRSAVASSAPVTALLLTDGACPIAFAPGTGPRHERARTRFNEGTPESSIAAVELLTQDFATGPSFESGVLLAMSLVSLSDPGLAAPIARACFRAVPSHPYAGVTMLLALRQLGRLDAARQSIPEVEAAARVDAWGSAQLASVRKWCGLPPRASVAPVPFPVPVHAGGDDEP